MSVWEPCEKCGLFVSKGISDDIICHNCSKDESKKKPKKSLSDLAREEWENTKVKHVHYGKGTVKGFIGGECEVNFENSDDLVVIYPSYLELVE